MLCRFSTTVFKLFITDSEYQKRYEIRRISELNNEFLRSKLN